MVKVAINGFGRIGRAVLKICLAKGIKVVAINDLADIKNLAYLFKYDSIYGNYPGVVSFGKDYLKIGNKKIKVLAIEHPEYLPWKKMGVDIVIESTGRFTHRIDSAKHLKAGAKKVLISAPGKDIDATIVCGVNDKVLKKTDKIISVASCTTNCLAPIVKLLDDKWEIKRGFMTTIHGYTSNQKIHDAPHKKFRRGRAGALNIVPTSSGATSAIGEVIPHLKGKLDGMAMRVPVPTGSIVDFTVELRYPVTAREVNNLFKEASKKQMKGILEYSEDELVSTDIIKNPHSSIVDSLSTQVIGSAGNLVKILSWYDNEWGYSNRMVDMIKKLK